MNEQKLDWGRIEWLFEPEGGNSDNMRIGISHMKPGAHQPRHVHGGDEQMMHIISGHGHQIIDNVEYPVEPGRTYHISCGVSHEAFNDGNEEIVKLLVSIPAVENPLKKENGAGAEKTVPDDVARDFLHTGVANIYEQMLGSLHLPVAIMDVHGSLVFRGGEYPSFCCKNCHIDESIHNCPLYHKHMMSTVPHYEKPSATVCEYGMSVFVRPVEVDDGLVGYILAGHIRTEAPRTACHLDELPFNVPRSHISGIVKIIESIDNAIQLQYRRYRLEQDLRRGHDSEELLKDALSETRREALDLRINRHFLFNTLNSILGMAIRENAEQTYTAVANLSQMLQYAFNNESVFVSLRQELTYLKSYTTLQKLRFGEKLQILYDIDQSLCDEPVPFNFLQPIVENVFRHAFENTTNDMKVSIQISKAEKQIAFTIQDNGSGIDKQTLIRLKKTIKSGEGNHGMPMIAAKLNALYGAHYLFDLNSGAEGTTIKICLPRKETPKYEESFASGR